MADPEGIDLRPGRDPKPIPITTADLRYIAENLLSLAAWIEAAAQKEDDRG